MSRSVQTAVLVVLLVAFAPAASLAGGNANFTIGERALNDEGWEPLEGQLMFGAAVDWGMDGWPVHLAWGLNVSVDSEDGVYNEDLTAAFAEISFGALWLPIRDKPFRPYLGAGIASVSAAFEAETYYGVSSDADDQDFGYYANAGVYWRLGPRFNLGIDLRYGWGTEFNLSFESKFEEQYRVDGDYFAYSLLLGFGWGN